MTAIKYKDFNGLETLLDVEPGRTIMSGAVDNLVEGISQY